MCHGISGDEIEKMDNTEVILLRTFVEKYDEMQRKNLAIEIAKTMWGKK